MSSTTMRSVTKKAIPAFKSILVTNGPFPTTQEQLQYVVDSWDYALKLLKLNISLDDYAQHVVFVSISINHFSNLNEQLPLDSTTSSASSRRLDCSYAAPRPSTFRPRKHWKSSVAESCQGSSRGAPYWCKVYVSGMEIGIF